MTESRPSGMPECCCPPPPLPREPPFAIFAGVRAEMDDERKVTPLCMYYVCTI